MIKKYISIFTITSFLFLSIWPSGAFAQEQLILPPVGKILPLSPAFIPLMIKGLKVHKDNPFEFDFIVNQGQENLTEGQFKEASLKLVKYFLVSLAIPENDLWVNLSPYEKNRITTPELGATEMGKDLLSQDYVLKQLTSSLIYPEGVIGKKFWSKVYAMTQEKYHTTNVPINTFNKVWIVPQKAVIYENSANQIAYVLESKLKVMLEQDYLALKKGLSSPNASVGNPEHADDVNALGSEIVREIVIPELTREVNTGKNFANLRQITNSLILAAWFKRALKESILGKLYVDQKKIGGVELGDNTFKERIFQQYLRAYKKGAYNYIKEEKDPLSNQIIPHKYFSGGYKFHADFAMTSSFDPAQVNENKDKAVTVILDNTSKSIKLDLAMIGGVQKIEEIPAVKNLFQPFGFLLNLMLERFGVMPETVTDQKLFAKINIGELQRWLDHHFLDLLNLTRFLPVPNNKRYTRNLVWSSPDKGVYVFMHLLGPGKSTPKHWHSENGVNALGFAGVLGEGGVEMKWKQENVIVDTRTQTRLVQLKDAKSTTLRTGQLVAIPGDYGVHQITNYSNIPLILFEIYFEPQELNNIDVPIPVLDTSTDHIIDTIPTSWLTDPNFLHTALRENWQLLDRLPASQLILETLDPKVFTVNNGETLVLPSEEIVEFLKLSSRIYKGPGKRYLVLKDSAQVSTVNRLNTHRQEALDPGGIDLSTKNLEWDIKYDGHGIPLPIQYQNLENIHINRLKADIVNVMTIADLPKFLGANAPIENPLISPG